MQLRGKDFLRTTRGVGTWKNKTDTRTQVIPSTSFIMAGAQRSSVVYGDFDVLGLMVTYNLTVDLGQGSTTALKRREFQTTRGIHDDN